MTLEPFIKGKYTLVWSILLYLIGVYLAIQNTTISIVESNPGLIFDSIDRWIPYPWFSSFINSMLVLLGGILLLRLNNIFSIIPKRTLLPLIFFLLLEIAMPQLTQLCCGNVIAVVMIALLFPLFFSYQQMQADSAFLIMGSLSLCSFFCPTIIYYIPLLFVGFIQIRYLNIKSILGALVGIVTPFWIIMSFGWVTVNDLTKLFPSLSLQIPEAASFTQPHFWIIVLTVILGVFMSVSNIYSTFTEKRQIRSYNGFITLLSFYTIILLLLDYAHYTTYLPLLNVTVSLQAAFFFTNSTRLIGHILFYFVLTLYIGLFVWNFLPV